MAEPWSGRGEAGSAFLFGLEACVYAEVLCQIMLTLRIKRGNM